MQNINITDTKCSKQCFIINFNKGKFLRLDNVWISNAKLLGEVIRVTGQLTIEIKNSQFKNINCEEPNIGNAFVFNPIQKSSILIERT